MSFCVDHIDNANEYYTTILHTSACIVIFIIFYNLFHQNLINYLYVGLIFKSKEVKLLKITGVKFIKIHLNTL